MILVWPKESGGVLEGTRREKNERVGPRIRYNGGQRDRRSKKEEKESTAAEEDDFIYKRREDRVR